jgi:hypothetical protein
LYESNPQNVGFKNGLAISYSKHGAFYRDKRNNGNRAREYFSNAKTLWNALAADFPAYAEFRKNRDWVKGELENC